MGRSPCCAKAHTTKGAWTPEEDELLSAYVNKHGEGNWRSLPSLAGLQRCGKSCRLRWVNYLRPHLKRGNFTEQEDEAIINMHKAVGNRWSIIAGRLQGRTDNEIKNRWNTYIKKKLIKQGIDPKTHKPMMLDTVGLKTVVAGAGGVRGAVGASSSSVSSGTTSCDQDVGSANTSIRVREEHNRRYLNQHNNIGSQLLQPQARFQLFWLPPAAAAAAASASGSSSPALVDLELSLGLPLLTTTPQSKSNISSSSSCSPDHTSRSATPSSPVCLCCRLATTDTDACSCQTDFTPAAVSNAAGNGVTNHHPNGQAFGIVHLGRFYAQSYGSS